MHWLDIVFIVFILIFGFVGFKKGFIKAILGLFTFLVSLVLVIWLAPKVVPVVDGWFDGSISKFFIDLMEGVVKDFGGANANTVLPVDTKASEIVATFEISDILKALINAIVGNDTIAAGTNVTEYFSVALGNFVTLAAGAVVLYIVFKLVLALLGKIFDKISENRAVSGLDRILGFALGVVKGLLVVAVILIIIKVITFIPLISNFITDVLNDSVWVKEFANWFYELLDKVIDKIDFNALIKG